ncbi:MAG: 2,3-bisphosphoglycerate-independent phosphoglycerate mutase [Nitriliruptoraceae bacterium]
MQLRELVNDNPGHLVLLVIDGLGGYADARQDSELEAAITPNLDRLAAEAACGLALPAGPGITVGSGPGHLALFGYDPLEYDLGRGLLSAVGLGVDLQPGDIAARGNLALLDGSGRVTDRRAGRIEDGPAQAIVSHLQRTVELDDVEVRFEHISEHRVLLVLRGEGLDPQVEDLDPQRTGVPPREPTATSPAGERLAAVLSELDTAVRQALAGQDADIVLFRGFDTLHELPRMQDRFGLHPATVATYPMYRGVAQLVGMDALPVVGTLAEQIELMGTHWDTYDYLFAHEKAADRAGHDGDREAKIAAIEAVDAVIPDLVELGPDVLAITGDHAAPTQLSAHSWHPVPTLLWGEKVGRDRVETFGERACATGILGHLRTQDLLPLMLASAGRLEKYGA